MTAEAPPAAPAPPAPAAAPVDYVCSMCGGNHVTRDAWAEWDVVAQDWTLGAAFDYAFCHDCEEETNLVEVHPSPPASRPAASGPSAAAIGQLRGGTGGQFLETVPIPAASPFPRLAGAAAGVSHWQPPPNPL